MYQTIRLAAIGLATLSATACADLYEPVPKVTKVDNNWVLSNTASLANSFITDSQSDMHICLQSAPDATFDQSDGGNFDLSLIATGGSSDRSDSAAQEASEGAEMAGRTPAVLIARELFYRSCEFSQNFNLSKQEALELYKKTMDLVSKGWLKEAGQTTVTVGDTVTTTQGLSVTASQAATPSDGVAGVGGAAPDTGAYDSSSGGASIPAPQQ